MLSNLRKFLCEISANIGYGKLPTQDLLKLLLKIFFSYLFNK